MNGDLRPVADFGEWIRALQHPYKILIAGNHERSFEVHLRAALRALGDKRDGLHYLQDSGITIAGVEFWGSPWQPAFNDWAFNLARGEALAAKWACIPPGTDVLVTHAPPHGLLDAAHGESLGCADLRERVAQVRPRLHVFGHIHEGSGALTRGPTTFVNASICDAGYQPMNPPHIFEHH